MLSDLSHTPKQGGRYALAEGLVLVGWPDEATSVVYNSGTASTHLVTAWAGQLLCSIEASGDVDALEDSEDGGEDEAAADLPGLQTPPAKPDATTPEPGLSREAVQLLQAQTLEGLLSAGLVRRLK